jgi:branched-subunit amino acid ABC-type transport system permease component
MRNHTLGVALVASTLALPLPASAQDAYTIGLTGALTGPPASTYAPAVDALRIYIDRLNAAGGVNGRKINLILQDDSAQPDKAAANAKKLLTQDNVLLMLNASLSSTYAPVTAEAKTANVPLLFASSVCPPTVYPPAEALQFCTTAFAVPGGARISFFSALLILTTAVVYGSLLSFLRFGRWGIRMRAAGQSPLLAAQRGINLHAVYALAWGLSTLTGALAGILIALDSGLDQTMAIIGLKAFPAALVGGLDSLAGALVGSLIVAAAEVLLIHYVDPLLSEVVPFLVLIAMLVVRPWGLFGTREELDRV